MERPVGDSNTLKGNAVRAAAVLAAVISLAACSGPAPSRVFKVGILTSPVSPEIVTGLKEGLAELGYREGENVVYVSGGTDPQTEPASLAEAARELVGQKVDLLFPTGTAASLEAAKLSGAVPVVFAGVADPVEAGLVTALVSPDNKVTGVATKTPVSKELEYLQRMVPGVRSVLLPYATHPTSARVLPELREAASRLDLRLEERVVEDRAGLQAALAGLSPGQVQAIFTMPNPLTSGNLDVVGTAALKHRLPLVASAVIYVNQPGVLFSYSADMVEVGRQAAGLVDKVLRGTPVGALPVELPRRYYLVINLATAKAIGLSVPQDLLRLADRLITE